MTDSFSKEDNLSDAEMMMAKDLMAKIREAKASTKMTDLLMIGNFRMELVPSNDRDNAVTFKEVMLFLHDKYGNELLKTDNPIPQGQQYG